jgi:pimeloyl-ACP methyl ester carboxylesterase
MINIGLMILACFLLAVLSLALFTLWYDTKIRQKFPAPGQYLSLDNVDLHYIERGSGRDVLIIHGLNGSAANFSYALIDRLAEHFHVIAIDRPGAGYSKWKGLPDASLANQARIISEFIRKKGLDPLVVGHSLGGAIALQLGLDYPRLARGFALISPLTQAQSQVPAAFQHLAIRSPLLRKVYARTLATPRSIFNSKNAVKTIFYPEAPPRDFAVKGGGLLSISHGSYLGASNDLTSLEGPLLALTKRYASLDFPVSVLYGREDQILDYKVHGESLEAINSNFHVESIAGGHMLVTANVPAVAEFVRNAEEKSQRLPI